MVRIFAGRAGRVGHIEILAVKVDARKTAVPVGIRLKVAGLHRTLFDGVYGRVSSLVQKRYGLKCACYSTHNTQMMPYMAIEII